MTSKRTLEREVEKLSDAVEDLARSRSLRQNIPHGLIEEWENESGHCLDWVRDLERDP